MEDELDFDSAAKPSRVKYSYFLKLNLVKLFVWYIRDQYTTTLKYIVYRSLDIFDAWCWLHSSDDEFLNLIN